MPNLFCPKIVFLCPPAFGRFWAAKGLSDLIVNDTQIHIRVDKANYQISAEGEKDAYVDYWNGVRVAKGMQRLVMKLTVDDIREEVEIMMRSLSGGVTGNTKKVLVTCYDFQRRLVLEDLDRGYSIHTGILRVTSNGNGSLTAGHLLCNGEEVAPLRRQYYTSGFRLELLETEKLAWNFN
jgi:hypothetical protein